MEVNPEAVINDLLDQIKRLTLENSMLRSAIAGIEQEATVPPAASIDD